MAVALLVAAGRGERLGTEGPKAFVSVAGRPMLEWSLEALRATPAVERIVVALPPGITTPAVGAENAVEGGATRSRSVRAALAAAGETDVIVVHDAARPLASPALFSLCIEALGDGDAVVAAAAMTDTVKETAPGGHVVKRTLDRSSLWAVQTPQVFRRAALERALDQPEAILDAATDDAGLVEGQGGTVRVVPSGAENFKITDSLDLRLAEMLLCERLASPPC